MFTLVQYSVQFAASDVQQQGNSNALHYLSMFDSTFHSNAVITKLGTFTCDEVRFSAIVDIFTSLLCRRSNDVARN